MTIINNKEVEFSVMVFINKWSHISKFSVANIDTYVNFDDKPVMLVIIAFKSLVHIAIAIS